MQRYNLDIVIAVPGMAFNGDTLDQSSLGGSETAGLCMARELAKLGHHVVMFNNCTKPGTYDGVSYAPIQAWENYSALNLHDVSIIQRAPELFRGRLASKLNILWQHDLALVRSADVIRSTAWNVDKIVTVSDYMTKQYMEVLGFDEDAFWTSRNGIDLARFDGMNRSNRNRKQLIYAARPERGLDVLLRNIMPKLLAKDPSYSLIVCGYNNTVPEMAEFYQSLLAMMEQFQGKVKWAGSLTKKDLYNLYSSSGLYAYPTPSPVAREFAEVSCISAMECFAAGLPFLSTNRGALKETTKGKGSVLLEGDPWTEEYQNQFVDKVLEITQNDILWQRLSNEGKEQAKQMDWAGVAKEWSEKFHELIEQRNGSKERLSIHFMKRSDIFAASKAIEGVQSPHATKIRNMIEDQWGFRRDAESFKRHYKEMGEVTDDRLEKIEWKEEFFDVTNEKRFMLIEDFLRKHTEVQTVLDYGCGHGWHDIYMQRKVGRKWIGVDVDPGAVKWSERFKKFCTKPEDLLFVAGNLDDIENTGHPSFLPGVLNQLDKSGKVDCLLLTEVLEHCIDPVDTVERLEKWVKPGGWVFITVPYGPREYPDYKKIKHRNHLHELDVHCLREIFGDKKDIEISGVFETMIAELEEPAGFYVLKYKADQKPLGRINWTRKLELQRPTQTVGAAIIAGGGCEETLHWNLRSIKDDVDGIIVADCGMNDEAKRIAAQYNIQVVPGKNPLEEGFEEARNTVLPFFPYDWILWIDTDERLFGGNKIHKYLRENLFHGYSVKQHHFAVDTTFNPDLPVRLVRNRPWKENPIKWYGSLHEHPEAGLNNGPGPSIILSDVNIAHLGYLYEEDRKKRFWRNRPLLLKSVEKYPTRILNKHFIMRDNMLLCSYEAKASGGRISEGMRKLAQETIDIYRENFLGKGTFLNVDSLEYYSQACRVLGLGAEVSFSVNADKVGNPVPEVKQYRFATREDLEKELEKKAKESMDPLTHKWW